MGRKASVPRTRTAPRARTPATDGAIPRDRGAATPAPPRRVSVVAAAVVAVAAVVAMAPGLSGELLNWDDDRFVAQNELVHGFDAARVRALFAAPRFEAYHPLHLVSYMADFELFGLWAPGYKLHNLALYLLCLVLLFLVARRMGLDRTSAWAATLLFAVHPLHVEAVVWVTARKETLSLALMLGSALAYLRAASWHDRYGLASAALFVAALLTKTSTVVLPALLLAADLLVLRRPLRAAAVRLAPLAVAAAVVGAYVLTLWTEHEMARPLPERGAVGLVALVGETGWHYLRTMAFPVALSPVYPIDRVGAFGVEAAAGFAAWAALVVAAVRSRDRWLALGVVWAAVALAPVSNVVPVYFFVQDRYAFVATVGAALAAGRLVGSGSERGWPRLAGALLAVTAAALLVAAAAQARHWRTSLDLWRHATAAQPDAYYGHLALGHTLRDAGDLDGAVTAYERAIALEPAFPTARIALCLADARRNAARRGRPEAEVDRVGAALGQHWRSPAQLRRLAAQVAVLGYHGCAILAESRASDLDPPGPEELVRAASRWTLLGRGRVALDLLERAAETAAPDATALEVEAQALALVGRDREARDRLRRSLDLAPRPAERLLDAARRLNDAGRPELALLYADVAPPSPDLQAGWDELRRAAHALVRGRPGDDAPTPPARGP
jgi:tetratricopeptide (TPR) repeat protein